MVLSLLVPFAIIDLPNRRDPEVRIVANPPASSVCAHLRLRVRRNHKRAHCQLRPKSLFQRTLNQLIHEAKDFTMN